MTTQRKNINNEQFFTNYDTARRLATWIKEQDWYSSITRTIEPSAGDGAWLDVGLQVDEAYDIEPMHDSVQKVDDWLTYDVGETKGKTLYVGNPPFGRMGKLAKAFMNHCANTGDYIAFILPASMAKVTQIRQIDSRLHLIHQEDLLSETFRFERDGKVVSTVFQVWERRQELRVDPKKKTSCSDFSFATTSEVTFESVVSQIIAKGLDKGFRSEIVGLLKESFSQRPAEVPKGVDIAICTHGSGVGKVHPKNFNSKSTRTHRFINIDNPNLQKEKLTKRLRSLDYESIYKYSTGATCVSKEEIVYLYCNKYLTTEI
jgi:uncharacterized protein YkuJ